MYLEKLEIQGFKSFANKTKLEFSGLLKDDKRGITAIVGPNGSGKSNIADAVRWVLGEQSNKTLRGKKGEDIIFSGSDKKSRLGMAEVSLFLRNDSKVKKEKETDIISPFDYDELIITRRLNRNGESEYLINNNRVRLSDIQILLAKANIGQKTYSIIGQGLVENFLNTSAADKKEFFDEATGVKSFQIKRDQALNKLERSYENLSQAEMLLVEIKPRLKTLTRQVEKIKKREILEKDLLKIQNIYYNQAYQVIAEKLDKLNLEILSLEKNKKEKEKDLESIIENNRNLNEDPFFEEEQKIKERLINLQTEKNKLIKGLAQLQAEISIHWESKGNFDLSWLNNKKDELEAEKIKVKDKIKQENNNSLKNEEENLKIKWQELQTISSQIENNKQKEVDLKDEIDNLNQSLIRVEFNLNNQEKEFQSIDPIKLKQEKDSLNKKLITINNELNNLNIKEKEIKVENLKNIINEKNNELNNKRKDLKQLNEEIKEKSQQGIGKKTISQEINLFINKLEAIEKEEDLNKFKNLVFAARQEFKEKIKKLIGFDEEKFLEKIKVTQEEIINLNEKLQKLTEDYNNYNLELTKLETKNLSLLKEKEETKIIIKNINDKLEKNNNLDLSDLRREKEKLIIEIKSKKQAINLIREENKYKNINDQKEELLTKLNDCRFKIASQEEKIKLLEQSYYNLNQEVCDIEEKIKQKQSISDKKDLEEKKKELEKILFKQEEEINSNKDKLEKINNIKQAEKKEYIINQNKAENLRYQLNELNNSLHNLQLETARQETKLEDLEQNIKNENLNLNEIKKPIVNISDNNEEFDFKKEEEIINNIKRQLDQIGSFDPETEKEWEETKTRYDFLSKQTSDLNQTINSLEKIIKQLDEKIKSQWEKEFKIITEKFNKYFNILFSGGQAKIIKVSDEKDDNEEENNKSFKNRRKRGALGLSGIDILAVPPGKKIQSIAMLSGGERALTVIALICAIINSNPSPFVVLDEVDAALDEANSEKLAKILDDLSNQTQFIIITHNRATMRKAEVLYGVTMHKDGVSQLLSVKLEEAIKVKNS